MFLLKISAMGSAMNVPLPFSLYNCGSTKNWINNGRGKMEIRFHPPADSPFQSTAVFTHAPTDQESERFPFLYFQKKHFYHRDFWTVRFLRPSEIPRPLRYSARRLLNVHRDKDDHLPISHSITASNILHSSSHFCFHHPPPFEKALVFFVGDRFPDSTLAFPFCILFNTVTFFLLC